MALLVGLEPTTQRLCSQQRDLNSHLTPPVAGYRVHDSHPAGGGVRFTLDYVVTAACSTTELKKQMVTTAEFYGSSPPPEYAYMLESVATNFKHRLFNALDVNGTCQTLHQVIW